MIIYRSRYSSDYPTGTGKYRNNFSCFLLNGILTVKRTRPQCKRKSSPLFIDGMDPAVTAPTTVPHPWNITEFQTIQMLSRCIPCIVRYSVRHTFRYSIIYTHFDSVQEKEEPNPKNVYGIALPLLRITLVAAGIA